MDPNLENQNQGPVIDESALFEQNEVVDDNLTQDDITAEIVGEKPSSPATTGTPSQMVEDTFESYIENSIKAVIPEYQLPEAIKNGKKADGTPLSAKEKHELLVQQIIDNTDFEGDQDDFMRQYKQAKASGIDANSFVNQYNSRVNLLNMPSADFIKTAYRNVLDARGERRYSDEDIDKLIGGKSQIELDQYAEGMKRQYAQAQFQKMEASNTASIEAENQKYQPIVNAFVDQLKSGTSVYGFELSNDEKEALGTDVSKLFVRNTRDGMNEFERMMSDDNFVLQVAPLLLMVKSGKYNSAMKAMKEAIKAKVIDKLDPNPSDQGGGLGASNSVDESKLFDV